MVGAVNNHGRDDLLQSPTEDKIAPLQREQSTYRVYHDFDLAKAEGYQQQYGDLYFLRLAKLKPTVEKIAGDAWEGFQIHDDTVHKVERVLDVRQGEFCWVVGTVYMDMPNKPNILDDIARDQWIAAPPLQTSYASDDNKDKVMLEDESGRLRLIGAALQDELLVTGCIIAVMGTENADGDFEVLDIKIPDLATQSERWVLDKTDKSKHFTGASRESQGSSGKVAFVSGLNLTGNDESLLALELLVEYLTGEAATPTSQAAASQITRLFVVGNSLARANPILSHEDQLQPAATKKSAAAKLYGYDTSSASNAEPAAPLDAFLADLLPSLPVTILPGSTDPANVSLPQQSLHPALFPQARAWADPPNPTVVASTTPTANPMGKPRAPTTPTHPLHAATNPALLEVGGHRLLATAGQPVHDIEKYLGPAQRHASPLDLAEATLRWRVTAPTAPDTLWCYPYQTGDPFVVMDGAAPRVYVVGNCPRFESRVVRPLAGGGEDDGSRDVRCICLPEFSKTAQLVLLDLDSLVPEVVTFDVLG